MTPSHQRIMELLGCSEEEAQRIIDSMPASPEGPLHFAYNEESGEIQSRLGFRAFVYPRNGRNNSQDVLLRKEDELPSCDVSFFKKEEADEILKLPVNSPKLSEHVNVTPWDDQPFGIPHLTKEYYTRCRRIRWDLSYSTSRLNARFLEKLKALGPITDRDMKSEEFKMIYGGGLRKFPDDSASKTERSDKGDDKDE